MALHRVSVFINVPFDNQYERLYLALIAGIVGLGAYPRSTLEVPPTKDRLRRIFRLIQSCDISIHDLSRVQLSRSAPRCPRFNMPFEAGLAAASFLRGTKRNWYLLESERYRLQKSLSDLNGYEVNIHLLGPERICGTERFRAKMPQVLVDLIGRIEGPNDKVDREVWPLKP